MDSPESARASVVKSVARTLEVLELFAARQVPLSAKAVEQALDYPPSSTFMLLKSMTELGYLQLDRATFSYFPTIRVALLGDWLKSSALVSELVITAMRQLHEVTGETIFLSTPDDVVMRTSYFIPGRLAVNLSAHAGMVFPMTESAVGLCYLSTLPPGEVDLLIQRMNKLRRGRARIVASQVAERVSQIRKQGYAAVYDILPSVGSVTMPVPSPLASVQQIIGIGGLDERVRAEEKNYVRLMKAAVRSIELGMEAKR